MALLFKKLTIEDISAIRPYITKSPGHISDYSIGGLFMWRDLYHTEFAISEGTLFLRYHVDFYPGMHTYLWPLGENSQEKIDCIFQHAREAEEVPFLHFAIIPEEKLPFFEEHYQILHKEERPEWRDYLYHASDLIELKGSKYSAKRNHLHQFESQNPDHSIVPLLNISREETIAFLDKFYEQKEESNPTPIEREEKIKTYEVLNLFPVYGMRGAVLLVNGKLAALSVGEVVDDVMYVHIEKGDTSIHGTYPAIMNAFSRLCCPEHVKYINREEDDGIAGLQALKESYHPCNMVKKYTLVLK